MAHPSLSVSFSWSTRIGLPRQVAVAGPRLPTGVCAQRCPCPLGPSLARPEATPQTRLGGALGEPMMGALRWSITDVSSHLCPLPVGDPAWQTAPGQLALWFAAGLGLGAQGSLGQKGPWGQPEAGSGLREARPSPPELVRSSGFPTVLCPGPVRTQSARRAQSRASAPPFSFSYLWAWRRP